jgi:hypothetical protein
MAVFVLEMLPKSRFMCHSLGIIVLDYMKDLKVLIDDVNNKCLLFRMCHNIELQGYMRKFKMIAKLRNHKNCGCT